MKGVLAVCKDNLAQAADVEQALREQVAEQGAAIASTRSEARATGNPRPIGAGT